jgi:hypothetical protein
LELHTWLLRYLLAKDFMTPCRTKKEIQERREKYAFYAHCTTAWDYYTMDFKNIKETVPGKSEYFQQKRNKLPSLLDKFIFDVPGNLQSYMEQYQRYDKTRTLPRYMVDFDYVKPSEQSIALFLRFIEFLPDWAVMHIIEKRPELLNVTISYLGPPLRTAMAYNRQNSAAALIEKGADIFQTVLTLPVAQTYLAPSKYENILVRSRIFHALAQYINDPELKLYHYFIQEGASINEADSDGAMPIHYAALTDNVHVFEALVEYGADVNAKTKFGKTAFHVAIGAHSVWVRGYLLRSKAVLPPDINRGHLLNVVKWVKSRYWGPDLKIKIEATLDLLREKAESIGETAGESGGIPVNWKRASFSADAPRRDGYLSLLFEGLRLRRVEFKFCSHFAFEGIDQSL